MKQESRVGRRTVARQCRQGPRSQASCSLFCFHSLVADAAAPPETARVLGPWRGSGEKSPHMGLQLLSQSVTGRCPLQGGWRTEGVAFQRLRGTAQGEVLAQLGSEPAWIRPSPGDSSFPFLCLSMGHNTNHLISAFLLPFYLFTSQAYTHGIFMEVDTLCTLIPFWSYITSLTGNHIFRDPELPVWPLSALTVSWRSQVTVTVKIDLFPRGERSLLSEQSEAAF